MQNNCLTVLKMKVFLKQSSCCSFLFFSIIKPSLFLKTLTFFLERLSFIWWNLYLKLFNNVAEIFFNCTSFLSWILVLTNMVFNEFLVISTKISRAFHFWLWKTLIQNPGLTNTTFREFPIISNKNIGFLLKFYHGYFWASKFICNFWITEIYRISNACSSWKHFHSNVSFASNYILVTINLYIVKKWPV